MRRRLLLLGLLGLVGVLVASGSSAATLVAAGWGRAVEVPGTAALNSGGFAHVNSVSCAAAGACVAGGSYESGSGSQAFVVSEKNGKWSHAAEVPGSATLNGGGDAGVSEVSCVAVGNCSAAGSYLDGFSRYEAFVVSEKNGKWGHAIEVPGTASANVGGFALAGSISCAAVGECVAGGSYRDGSGFSQAFVVSEKKGHWGQAIEVPGTATLNSGGNARVYSVSCAAVGQCAAGGYYNDGSGYQAFVVGEKNGIWGQAIEVPGTATLNGGFDAKVESISCATARDCVAGGRYTDGSGYAQAFVINERNGHWSHAIEVPGTATLNSGGDALVDSVSCGAAGACVAGGFYYDGTGSRQAFVVSAKNHHWGQAVEVPGTATLNSGGQAIVHSISCSSARDCAAAGSYTDGAGHSQAFVVSEKNRRWGKAIKVPGTAKLNHGGIAQVYSVSCSAARQCAAGGYYTDGSGHSQAFVVNSTSR